MKNNNIFRIRAFPQHVDHYLDFIQNNFIGLGWTNIGDIKGLSKSEISAVLKKKYPNEFEENKRALGLTTGFFQNLISMRVGDLVLIPYQKAVTIVKVTKPYKYTSDDEIRHRVTVRLLTKLPTDKLSMKLRGAINTKTSLISLNKYSAEIHDLLDPKELNTDSFQGKTFVSNNTNRKILISVSENVSKSDLENFVQQLNW